ncbi:MAG: phosphatase PAP2 family protein [Lachnospiraceae bacterium]|nr:phosphatase PAP2 family protein [Lachnospiraceae bacterium]
MNKIKTFLSENKMIFMIPLYAAFYLPCFILLERAEGIKYHIIHMKIDDYIPFCEYFIIFYYLWFIYMIISVAYCVFTDRDIFYKSFTFLAVGMTLFLIISFVFPNAQHLRPVTFARDNVFTDMVRYLYSVDTPTNVFPSLHVFNAIGAHLAIVFNKQFKNNRTVKGTSLVICTGIILSTVFLKQHSLFDVIGACVMALALYPVIFRDEYRAFLITRKERKESRRAQA